MVDWVLKVTIGTAMTLMVIGFWLLILLGLFVITSVTLHSTGVFTCGTLWCT